MDTAADLLIRMARESGQPVLTEFGLYALARRLFADRGYAGIDIPPRNHTLTERRARKLLSDTTWHPDEYSPKTPGNRLPRDADFSSLLFVAGSADTIPVILAADPFCCLSHASAIAFHGFAPETADVHVATPDRATWRIRANEAMEAIIGFPPDEADPDELPFRLTRPVPRAIVRGRAVHRHEMRAPAAIARRDGLRATAIGETFRDALAAPDWCGGLPCVLDLWRRHAPQHLGAILDTIDRCPEKILRVRAGYLLEEVLGLADTRIDGWVADAQRGSSRKLDASAPYASNFSERWMLSINVPDPTLPSTRA